MFRIASITKLFTCTAVMQQVEEGKLDLDADVNSYLDGVQIPATFEQPVTLKHLMTHTAGFDDHVLGLFAHRRQDVPPLGAQVLASQMPTRVSKLRPFSRPTRTTGRRSPGMRSHARRDGPGRITSKSGSCGRFR